MVIKGNVKPSVAEFMPWVNPGLNSNRFEIHHCETGPEDNNDK